MDTTTVTGIWHGQFSYQHNTQTRVFFEARLTEEMGSISGTTREPHWENNQTLRATIRGQRSGNAISFTKAYVDPQHEYENVIDYTGTLNADGTEIEGEWRMPRFSFQSGKFLMIRPEGVAQAARREELEVVGSR